MAANRLQASVSLAVEVVNSIGLETRDRGHHAIH